jgi:hypothetical protein
MIAKNLQDKTWHDVRIVGLRKIELGQNGTQALEVVVRFADESQGSTNLFLTPKAIAGTRKRLEALGATEADLTGGDWLRKLNARLADAQASVVAEEQEKYGVRLNGPFPRGGGSAAREVEAGPSPFAAIGDEDVPF